jgi:CDP-4-dehydro-6-deoxyglucose reductase
MATEYHRAIVKNIIKETDTVNRFQLQFPDMDVYDFKAGQYVKVDLPIDDKKTYRQYSIASEPMGNNEIELLIVLAEHGKGTHYLFNEVSVGTELKVSKALGRFVLPEKIETEVCFICTGVGLAPFRSMIRDAYKNGNPDHKFHLIFGTRNKADMLYPDEWKELNDADNNFHYYPVLSRENDWDGYKGYVHQVYQEIFSDTRPANFYICGWDAMIKEARRNLKDEMGYERREILFEKYD